MRQLIDLAIPGQQAATLLILLPAAYQQPEDFIQYGFVAAVRSRALDMDLIMADFSFNQASAATASLAIELKLIQPAIAAGYASIWLVGISIGGYAAMAYADTYATTLSGMLLLAPYPGNRMTTTEIAAAGGLASWQPTAIASDDTERRNWRWLQTQANSSATLELHLAYGEHDRFAPSYVMMAKSLPAARVDHIAGGHTWPVWQQLWQHFLDKRFALHNNAQESSS
jgi:pimeloyl-ACP methyl ester carboxylesterase